MLSGLLAYEYRRWARVRRGFRKLWRNYLYQSLIAAVVVAIVIYILSAENAVVVASLGSTAFIVFTMPRNSAASPRRVIGSHLLGLLSGSLCALIPHSSMLGATAVYSLAVGVSALLMVATDLKHPPAAGTALGVAITGFSVSVALAVITSSILLSLAHHLLKRYLKDLI